MVSPPGNDLQNVIALAAQIIHFWDNPFMGSDCVPPIPQLGGYAEVTQISGI
jgi:hypothetical protein